MIMDPMLSIVDYSPDDQSCIRSILTEIGWAERYISAMEDAAEAFAKDQETYGGYLAISNGAAVGYLYVQHYAWNQLCQIQGLAVRPAFQRQGVASALVTKAEEFARSKGTRGTLQSSSVDTPTTNAGGRKFYEALGYQYGYTMPRYYEDGLDGVTYQKFFKGT